jgi:hypothetical protein
MFRELGNAVLMHWCITGEWPDFEGFVDRFAVAGFNVPEDPDFRDKMVEALSELRKKVESEAS